MYGYQGNNSQPFNYQNPNGSSYGNIGQYTGPYHSYYSNASSAYNTFPSNDQPCSSLGVLPQEYSQVGSGISRPYYFDSNNSYTRPYQSIPYNQSLDLPIANSYNSCPRNCHCCESINPKYFATSNSLQQQTNTQSICDPSLNAPYNGFRKGLNSGRWRESSSQLPNIHETNDSSSGWPLPKYGTSCKSEPCIWPLSHKQPTKFENTEHLATSNTYMLPQQHQRKSIPNNQTYSVLHSNSLISVQTSRPPQGRSDELMGNCFTGYPCTSDYKKNIVEHAPYSKSHINKITPNRPTCNVSSNCEGGFPYKFSSPNANVYHENQKCAIDSPKLVSQLPSTLVEPIQRRLPGSNLLDGTNEMPYCQSGLVPSVHSIDASSRRTYNIPTEGEPRVLLNCASSASNDVLPGSRIQLPPIHSLKPTGIVMNGPPKDFCDEFSYNPTRSSNKGSLDGSFRIPSSRNVGMPNVSMRNCNAMNPEKVPDIPSENVYRIQSEVESSCTLANCLPNTRYTDKNVYSEQDSSKFTEADNKPKICKDVPLKPLHPLSSNPVIGDLRHFLSTWDDGDDEESSSVAPCSLPLSSDCNQEQLVNGDNLLQECASVNHLQEKTDDDGMDACRNSTHYDVESKELHADNTNYECANSYKVFNSSSESNSFNVHTNTVVTVASEVVSDLGIPQKPCGELEHRGEQNVLKFVVNGLHSDAGQRPQETYNQPRLSPQSNLNLHNITTNASEKNESRSSSLPNVNVKGGREPSTSSNGKEDEVTSEILNLSASHDISSRVVDGMSAEENHHGETLEHPFDRIIGNIEESSCIINVEKEIPCCNDSESPTTFPKESNEESPVSEVVSSIMGSSPSCRSPKPTNNVLNDTFSGDHSPGNCLPSEKLEYDSNAFIWSNSESKDCTFDSKDKLVDNNSEDVREEYVKMKEIENDLVNGKIFVDQDLRVNEKRHDDCSHNDKSELETEVSTHNDTSPNKGVGEHSSIHVTEKNGVPTGINISNNPPGVIYGAIKEDSNVSDTKSLTSVSHLEKAVRENSFTGETCISPHEITYSGALNHHGSNQEQNELENLNPEYSSENQICQVDFVCRANGKLPLNQCDKMSPKFSSLKYKGRFVEPFRRVPNKSSYLVALLLRRKYRMMGSKIKNRAKLTEKRKKYMKNCSENYSCKRNSASGYDTKKHKIFCFEDENKPGTGLLGVTNDSVECGEKQEDTVRLKNEDDTFQKTHSIYSGKIMLLDEGNSAVYSESETIEETPHGENNVQELLSIEEGEVQAVNFEGNCIIGNVEVFMGTVEEANSFEEAVEDADAENVLHEVPTMHEEAETVNSQYWCNYELGNDLGVAMEIEVGSEIYSSDSVELDQQVKEDILPYNSTNERVRDSFEEEVSGHQERVTVLVKLTDDVNDVKTVDGKISPSTVLDECSLLDENRDTFLYKPKQNIEKCALKFYNSISCSHGESHPEKISLEHSSTDEHNINQSVDTLIENFDAEGAVMSSCSQKDRDLGVSLLSESLSTSNTKDAVQPKINFTLENSEGIESYSKESKQHILSGKATLNMTSLNSIQNAFCKGFKKSKKRRNSVCSDIKDLMKSHSTLHSNRKLQAEKNSVIEISSSDQITNENGQNSVHKPLYDPANGPEKNEGIASLKENASTKNGAENQVDSKEIYKCDSPKSLLSMLPDTSCKNELSGTGNQNQLNLLSECKKRHSLSRNKEENNQCHRGSTKILIKCPFKLKHNHKSNAAKDPMKECVETIHQQEPSNKRSIIKTKASLKSFDSMQLKSVNFPKFGFWKNRSWHHKRIFGQNFKTSTIKKSVNALHRIMSQPSKHTLPHILQICSTPLPRPLSPLPLLENAVGPNGEENGGSKDVSPPASKYKSLESNANENSLIPSEYSSLGMSEHSNNSVNLGPSESEFKFSSIHGSKNFCKSISDCMVADSEQSKPLSEIHSVGFNEQEMAMPEVTKFGIQDEKDSVTDSGYFSSHLVGESTSLFSVETKADSSWSMISNSLVAMDSSTNASHHVRLLLKKVLNGSNKNVWMKRSVTNNPEKKQDINPPGEPKTARMMSTTECESPLPKVTIKKKSGENGYQSFLSGFSSASSSPSTSPTVLSKSSSPLHMLSSLEKPSSLKCNMTLKESTAVGVLGEEFHTTLYSTSFNKPHNIQNYEMSNENPSLEHTNVVRKKEGSGLVFVIRGLGGKMKGCSIKDKDAKDEQPTPAKDCGLTNCDTQDTSACPMSIGEDDWESGPWNVWQPVVKLSRSCELDHLAMKLHSVHEDSNENNTQKKLPVSQVGPECGMYPKISGNELPSKPAQCLSQEKSRKLGHKKSIVERESSKNQNEEIISNRKGPRINFGTDNVEFDMLMKECDQLNLPKKKPKSGSKFQSMHKPTVASNNDVSSAVSYVSKGKIPVRKEKALTEPRPNRLSVPELTSFKRQVGGNGKNVCGGENEVTSSILPKGVPSSGKMNEVEERTLEKSQHGKYSKWEKQGTKAKRKIESGGGANDGKSVVKLTSSKDSSLPKRKSAYSPSKSVPYNEREGRVKHKAKGDSSASEEASVMPQESFKEDLQSKLLKHETESRAESTNRSPYVCEACCRTFSSQKWLVRHCKGVSHSRVQNAQRQAVQALLLLLTGSESQLLQPLTEKELSHLKKWSAYAVPSPLQLALNEFLDTT